MTLGKPDGKSFSLSFDWRCGGSVFVPLNRGRGCVAAGLGWRLVGVPGFKPNLSLVRISNDRPFARMWHLRRPFNVVRVGTWA